MSSKDPSPGSSPRESRITAYLRRAPTWQFATYAMVASFTTYFAMYAFRKPFSVGTFEGLVLFGTRYKIVLVLSQTIGYALSKLAGISVISAMTAQRRIPTLLVLIGVAELALLGFASTPSSLGFLFLFLNGLSLGMVWGIVFSFLEGRRSTEMLGAGLCTSFIVSSGAVKSVGAWLMERFSISEHWMPVSTGLVFLPVLLVAAWMLAQIPPPNAQDVAERSPREPITRAERLALLRQFGIGIGLLVLIYTALNTYRDFRDTFAAEIWTALGYGDAPAVFTISETPIALFVMVATAFGILMRDNLRAFRVSLLTVLFGAALLAVTTWLFRTQRLDGAVWMVLVGLGMYVPYVAFHVMVYERLLAIARRPSNIGYLMYISDTVGYLGSIGILVYRDFGAREMSWLRFFVGSSYALAAILAVSTIACLVYFHRRLAPDVIGSRAASGRLET